MLSGHKHTDRSAGSTGTISQILENKKIKNKIKGKACWERAGNSICTAHVFMLV
jgi:hypothetical protein